MKGIKQFLTQSINESWKTEWDDILDYVLDDMDIDELSDLRDDDPGEILDWIQRQLEDSDNPKAKSFAKALAKNDSDVVKKIQQKVDEIIGD